MRLYAGNRIAINNKKPDPAINKYVKIKIEERAIEII
jgi:ribosomal protein S12